MCLAINNVCLYFKIYTNCLTPLVCLNTDPKRLGQEHGGAALQGKDLRGVAVARLHV